MVDLAPGRDLAAELLDAKSGNRQQLHGAGRAVAQRLADAWLALAERGGKPGLAALRLADAPDKTLRGLAQDIHQWTLTPSGTAGYKKAEVMRGGVERAAGPEVHAGAHRAACTSSARPWT